MTGQKREIIVRDIMTTVTAKINGNTGVSDKKTITLTFSLDDICGNYTNNENNYIDPVIVTVRMQSRGQIDDYNNEEASIESKDEALHFRKDADGTFLEEEYVKANMNYVIVKQAIHKVSDYDTLNKSIEFTVDPLKQCIHFVVSKNKKVEIKLELNETGFTNNLENDYQLIITKINNGTNIISSVQSYRHQLKIKAEVDDGTIEAFKFAPLKSIENLLLEAKSFAKNTIDSYGVASDVAPDKYYGTHLGVTTMNTDTRNNSNKITTYSLDATTGTLESSNIDISGFIMAYKYNRDINTYDTEDFSYNVDISDNSCCLFDADIFKRDTSSNSVNKMFNQYVMCYEVPKSVNADVSVYQGKTVHYVEDTGETKQFVSTGITYTYIPGDYLKKIILKNESSDSMHSHIDASKNYTLVIGAFDFPSDLSNNDPQYTQSNHTHGVITFSRYFRPNSVTTNNNYKQRAHTRYGLVYDEATFNTNSESANKDKFLERINNFADITITLNGTFKCKKENEADNSNEKKISVGDTFDLSYVYLDKGVSGLDTEKVSISMLYGNNLSYLLPSTVVLKDSLLTNGLFCILARQINSNSVNNSQYKVVDLMRHKIDKFLSTDNIRTNIVNGKLTRIMVFEPNMRNGIHMNTLEPLMMMYDTYKREIATGNPIQPGDYADNETGLIDLTVKLDNDPFMWQEKIIEISKAYNTGQTSNTSLINVILSYTEDEGIKLMYSFIENLEIYRSGQITLIKNSIADAKLGGFEEFIETGEANNINMNETVTEIPGLHLGIYMTYSLYDTSNNIPIPGCQDLLYCKNELDFDGKTNFKVLMKQLNNFSIHCYDQNLQIGDGTTNSFQNEQIIDICNEFVDSVLEFGSKTKKYKLGTYYENSTIVNTPTGARFIPLSKPNNINNIALQTHNVEETGMFAFTNINVPYEKHNGVTIKFHDTLINMNDISYLVPQDSDKYSGVSKKNLGVQSIKANVVICSKETNDILGKMGVDMTDPISMSYLIASQKANPQVAKNTYLVSAQQVNIFSHDISTDVSSSDFNITITKADPDSPETVQRDVHMNLIIDMFRSTTTTLVAPVVVLNKVQPIDQMRQYILDKGLEIIGTTEDVAKNYLSVHRIRYDNNFDPNFDNRTDANGNKRYIPSDEFTTGDASGITLSKMFYPDGSGNSNLYTILRTNPAYVLGAQKGNDDALNKLAKTGVFDNSYINTFEYIHKDNCGHEGVFVETLYLLTNVLGNLLTDEGDTLDNLFWYLSDENNDTVFSKVPSSIFNPGQLDANTNFISARSYRKAITSVLYETTKSTVETFVDYYRNVQIPPRWMKTGEIYDGYYGLELLRYFTYTLETFYKNTDLSGSKIPIVFEDTGDYISFVDVGYHRETYTQYRRISKNFVKLYMGDQNYEKFLEANDTRVFYTVNDSAKTYIENMKAFIGYGRNLGLDNDYQTNNQLVNLWDELKNFSVTSLSQQIKGTDNELFVVTSGGETQHYPLHRYTILVLEALYLISKYGNSNLKKIKTDISNLDAPSDTYNIYYDLYHTRIIGSSVDNLKNRYEKIPFTVELSTRRIPRNLLMESTSFRLSEITLVNNSLLREVILDAVGKPVDMVAPIVLDLDTDQIDTVVNRDIKFDTDYLIEVNNRMDKNRLMNQIFYKIENGERKIVHVGKKLDYLIGPDYQPISKNASGTTSKIEADDIGGIADEKTLSNDLTELLMCPGDENTSIAELIQNTDYGQLKLANVKDDKTVRGILKDYRYHGVGKDQEGNPIFADDVPYMSGGLGMQVVRMISSGLVNKQNDVYIVSNRNQIVNNIRHPNANDLKEGMEYTKDSGYVSTIAKYLDSELRNPDGSDYRVTQFILEQLYLKDPLRFQVNEIARNGVTDQNINESLQKDAETMYMLPLTEDDTFSIASIVNGTMNDPYESKSETLSSLLTTLNSSGIGSSISSVSLTGTPIEYNANNVIVPSDNSGTFYNSNNLFYFSDFGPYEKYIVDNYDICNNQIQLFDKDSTSEPKGYLPLSDGERTDISNRLVKISQAIHDRLNLPHGSNQYDILNKGAQTNFKQAFTQHYLKLRQRSFHIRYLLKDDHNQSSYEQMNDNQTANQLYNETNDPTQLSNFLGSVEFSPTIIWMPRKIGDKNREISHYNVTSLDKISNSGMNDQIYLSDNSGTYSKLGNITDFGKTYTNYVESAYENTRQTFNIIQDYITKLNENAYTDIDIYRDLYFKLQMEIPVTELSVEHFVTVAKYIGQNGTGNLGYLPKIKLLEHNYSIAQALEVGDRNATLQDATETLLKSNKRNPYRMYSSNVENNTSKNDDDIGHIFVKEVKRFNIVDMVILSLFYNQLTTLSLNGGSKRIGKNEFFASIEKIIPTLAYQNIYVSMEYIEQKLEKWENEFNVNAKYSPNKLFPIHLQQYVQLLQHIVYNSYFVLRYFEDINKEIDVANQNGVEPRIESENHKYLEDEVDRMKNTISNNIESSTAQPPFDIRYYYNMFLRNERYPEWRLKNIPPSITQKLGLTAEKIKQFNDSNNEDMIHILWRIDFIWNLGTEVSSVRVSDGFDISSAAHAGSDSSELLFKELLFKEFLNNDEVKKNVNITGNSTTELTTWKEAFLFNLFDMTLLQGITGRSADSLTVTEQNGIYTSLRTVSETDNSNNKWMWEMNLDTLFSSKWNWPFDMHIFDFAPQLVLDKQYDFVLDRLNDLSNVGVIHPLIDYDEIKGLKDKLGLIETESVPNKIYTLYDAYDVSFEACSNNDGTYDSMYNLKESEYDGFFYSNRVFTHIVEQKLFSDSTFNFIGSQQYTSDRNELLENLTEMLEDWKKTKDN